MKLTSFLCEIAMACMTSCICICIFICIFICICICICNLVTYPTPMACMNASKFSLSVNWNFPQTWFCNLWLNWGTKIKVSTCYLYSFLNNLYYLIIAFSLCPSSYTKNNRKNIFSWYLFICVKSVSKSIKKYFVKAGTFYPCFQLPHISM